MRTGPWLRRFSGMASGGNSKRASMREGPLAALFRKTEEEGLHGEGAQQPQPQQAEPEAPTAPQAEQPERRIEPTTPAARTSEPDPIDQLRPAPPSARQPAPREPEPVEEPERRVRTPEERLRAVFSADIPENIMEPPREQPTAASSRPRYGREEPSVPV